MSTFQPGTNRARVYDLLTNKPKNAASISEALGLKRGAVQSVLDQISRLGYAKPVGKENGSQNYIRAEGPQPSSKPSLKSTDNKIGDKIDKYLAKNIGNVITIGEATKTLKIKNASNLRRMINHRVEQGHVTIISTIRPKSYRIEPSLLHPSQTELIPSPRSSPNPPPTVDITPDMLTPMQTSDAIGQLMQIENTNIQFRHAFHQILANYEQLGNILSSLGMLEED